MALDRVDRVSVASSMHASLNNTCVELLFNWFCVSRSLFCIPTSKYKPNEDPIHRVFSNTYVLEWWNKVVPHYFFYNVYTSDHKLTQTTNHYLKFTTEFPLDTLWLTSLELIRRLLSNLCRLSQQQQHLCPEEGVSLI